MLNKIKALFALFKAGEAVASPAKWKSRQISTTMLAGLIIAIVQLAKVFNYELPIDSDTATAIASGIIAVVNTVLTLTTSKSVGVSTTGIVRANQPSVPSVQQSTVEATQTEALQSEHVSEVPNRGIDSETRARAEQWAKQQSNNGLRNDA